MNIHEEFPKMTLGRYLKTIPMGFVYWIPMMIFAFIVPIIGWVLIPVAIFYPLFHPLGVYSRDKKRWKKARQEAIETATINKLMPKT